MAALFSKPRLARLIEHLARGLLERDTPVRLALLAALAGEHLLLIGPPGSAKSELARRLHRVFDGAAYFERLLTRFTVPEELFGPLSISALEQDRFERLTVGYLPCASIAFIDEVFKANSAILNALLTLLNEREFDNGARRVPTPLICVVGATNEVPEEDLLAAFYDRFLLRCAVEHVSNDAFGALLALREEPLPEVAAELRIAAAELAALATAREAVVLPADVVDLLTDLRGFLAEKAIAVSDRRWRKIVALLKTAALTDGRDAVSLWDLWLTQFCACHHPQQAGLVAEWFGRRLGTHGRLDPVRLTRVVEAFEATLEQEANAQDLAFDDSGKLTLARELGGSGAGDVAPRLSGMMNRRRWGAHHVAARTAQTDELLARIDDYLEALASQMADFAATVAEHLWIAPAYAATGRAALTATQDAVGALRARVERVKAGFAALPRRDDVAGRTPESIPMDFAAQP